MINDIQLQLLAMEPAEIRQYYKGNRNFKVLLKAYNLMKKEDKLKFEVKEDNEIFSIRKL